MSIATKAGLQAFIDLFTFFFIRLVATMIIQTVATEDILVIKMIENIIRRYTDHVVLHEVLITDHYESSEVHTFIKILVSF